MQRRHFLTGTYTTGRTARGVYLCAMDDAGGIEVRATCAMPDPSFIALHPREALAYVVNEVPSGHGSVTVIGLDGDSLAQLSTLDSGGELPCHLGLLPDASGLAVAHYGCGAVSVIALDAAGMPGGARIAQRHQCGAGHSPRQVAAHPHFVMATRAAAYVTDLGQDRVVVYTTNLQVQRCVAQIHAGAGPRHLCMDASRGIAWLGNELDNTVSRLAVGSDGSLTELDWCSTLPADFAGRSAVSEIALHPNGRWLYVGNRGHDSVAWFEIADDGVLTWGGVQSTGGKHPRHFSVTNDGAWLVVANRDSDSLCVFSIDAATGQPIAAGTPFTGVPAPVCVRWL